MTQSSGPSRELSIAAALVGIAAWCTPAPAPFAPWLCDALGISRRLGCDDCVALTFDDGPHPQGTPAVLDVLARTGTTATFFLVGEQVERFPALAAEVAAAGHEIAVHGYRHRLQLRRTPAALKHDLDRAFDAIGTATGRAPMCLRPPYGVFSAAGLMLTRHRGWRPVLWSQWGRDWSDRETAESVADRVTSALTAGDIVLLHDADHYSSLGSWRTTAAALPAIVDAAGALALSSVSISHSM